MQETINMIKNNLDLDKEIISIHEYTKRLAVDSGLDSNKINDGDIRLQSILYMVYWFHRLRNNQEEQQRVRQSLVEYIGQATPNAENFSDSLFQNEQLTEKSKIYVENLLVPVKTIDLVVFRSDSNEEINKEVLCIQRDYYPLGLALPGGIVKDEDEDNALGLLAHQFAALRVAGEKILGLAGGATYSQEKDDGGRTYFLVRGENSTPVVRIHAEDEGGYRFSENIKSVLRPSDPRHIVDTVGFKCEIEGEPVGHFVWRDKQAIMSSQEISGGFAFGHHREIVAFITSQTSVDKEREMKERDFVRSLIKDPLESYRKLKTRFDQAGSSPEVSFPELFPVVDRLLADIFREDINELCAKVPVLAGVRDKAVISLRHVCLKNRTFCPYHSTLRAIAEAVAFFDLVARQKKGFYDDLPKDKIIEHNPASTPHASYHMYRYKYRYDQFINMVPHEIIIPTYEALSATDLMRVRGVPIRFIGISHDFLYVDEFEQSPEEFFMHDCNHSWRMMMEDNDSEKYGKNKEQMIDESNAFLNDYLAKIKVSSSDNEEQREMKKLKKIILFEIVHEDARPFLKEVVCSFIQTKEGSAVPFEVPRIDAKTGYMDVVDTMDTGISTLSYVRNKLQHGFYDHIDAQLPQIVEPKYRTAQWISRAAYEMLVELEAQPDPSAQLDENGHVSYEWLLQRTCAAGPDNVHGVDQVDPDVEKYGDEVQRLNPKRYQVGGDVE